MNAVPSGPIGVLIVDDQPPFRHVARSLVSLLPGWQVIAEAASGEEAVERAAADGPDVVLMDINMPGINGIEATRQIVTANPQARVILLSTYAESDLPADALDSGAVAYVHKEDLSPTALLRALA